MIKDDVHDLYFLHFGADLNGFFVSAFHRDCTKSYHPECVNKDPTFLDADETWTCGNYLAMSSFICYPFFYVFC